ncbi:glutathione S-transferase [Tribonema minus]|uniref:Glutathione S-transferase n=1 Tax=Tribonema minus TaxID=303371 RepID=A0A835Z329_9STRA|nr:glutathione S-transferase [Tribonema minus]
MSALSGATPAAPDTDEMELFSTYFSRAPMATANVMSCVQITWYLHELGVKCKISDVKADADAAKRNPSPSGKVPGFRDVVDGTPIELFESGAILMYLAEKYGHLDTPAKRANLSQWLFFVQADLCPLIMRQDPSGKVTSTALGVNPPPRELAALEKVLGERAWLAGDELSAADVAAGTYLLYGKMMFADTDMSHLPNTAAYMERCRARPGYAVAWPTEP